MRQFRLYGSGALGLLFLAAFAATLGMDGSLVYPLSYAQALVVLTGVLFFLAMGLAWRERDLPMPVVPDAARGKEGGLAVLMGIVLLCVVYVAAWEVIGYFPSTFLFVAAALWLLRQRGWAVLLGVPVGATLVVYVVFYRLLQLPFPPGMLFG